jgi:TrpR family trp operon transcriptional repressor
MASFFEEIFTPKELKDLELRWELLKELHAGQTQRSIAARHKISLCKITRGSKVLKKQGSITKRLLDSCAEKKGK